MSKKKILLVLMGILVISFLVSIVVLFLDFWLLSNSRYLSPIEALFFEGILFIAGGALLLLGRGGINRWSLRTILMSALADAVYDEDTVGPSEVFRQDRWKPQGFTRLALVLIISGFIMLLAYFMNTFP